ncbi:MAG: hypothetical protein QM644_07585 [Mobilitalea sp.]
MELHITEISVESSNGAIATVDSSGKITAISKEPVTSMHMHKMASIRKSRLP